MTLISAHRCGAGADTHLENTRTALEAALEMGVDYIEFDVQRCKDGTFVLFHDDYIVLHGKSVSLAELTYEEFAAHADHFLRYSDVLKAIAGRCKAHIDLKFTSPAQLYADPESTYEVEATVEALKHLPAPEMIVTTLEDASVRAIRSWSRENAPTLLVGLSLGRDVEAQGRLRAAVTRLSELFPGRRYRKTDANLVVVNYKLARLTVAAWAKRKGLPMLVWTVDTEAELRYWLHHGGAWLVTTNYPEIALAVRRSGPPTAG